LTRNDLGDVLGGFLHKLIWSPYTNPGDDVMILKIFLPKNLTKILAFFAQTTASFCKKLSIKLVFGKNANFLAENM
jgi:hypothetical protein